MCDEEYAAVCNPVRAFQFADDAIDSAVTNEVSDTEW